MKAQDVVTAINCAPRDQKKHRFDLSKNDGWEPRRKAKETRRPNRKQWQSKEQRKEQTQSEAPRFRETRHGKRNERRSTWRQRNTRKNVSSMDNKVIKLFAEVLEGARPQNLLSSFECKKDTTRRSYIHDNSARSVHRPSGNTIPWSALWILSRFRPRRIRRGRGLPNVQKFTASLNSFANRVRWKWYSREKNHRIAVLLCHGKETHCTHPVPLALGSWLSNLRFS